MNVSKSRLQVGGVKLLSGIQCELASLLDGSITGDRICSFCMGSIAVRMNNCRKTGEMTNKTRFPIAPCSSLTTTTAKSVNTAGIHSLQITAHIVSLMSPSPPSLFQNAHDTTVSGNAHLNVGGRDIIVYGSQSSARAGTSKFMLYSSILPKLSMTSSTLRLA